MDTTLVTVTVLSMGMAAALSVIVWRLLRDERRRSEARVAALTAASVVRRVEHELPLRETPVSATAMFAPPAQETPWWHRLAVMAGLALVAMSVLLFALAARTRPAHASAAAGAGAAAAEPAAGLELLSLRDSRTADALTITGMVRNPSGAGLRSRVAVTAYAFDDKGAFLASGRALLDVTSLAPGDESPFVVAIPVSEGVARYRIGFRGEDGRVIGHVDKRQPGPMARLGSGQGNW